MCYEYQEVWFTDNIYNRLAVVSFSTYISPNHYYMHIKQ